MNPVARHIDVVSEEVGNELVLYDCRTHRAHTLNPTAALVWRHATGHNTVQDVTALVARELQTSPDSDLVIAALRSLSDAGLVDCDAPGVTRRDALKRSAYLMPFVLSVTAPTPAEAQSHVTQTPNLTQRSASIPGIVLFNNIDNQRCLEWCWAACAETIVRQFGVNVNGFFGTSVAQEYFAAKVYGRITPNLCMAAVPAQVAGALTDNYPLLGSPQRISLQGYYYMGSIPVSFNTKAVSLIRNGTPWSVLLVPVGQSSGHFLTVYAMQWTEDANGNVVSINSYTMADPFSNLYQFFPAFPRYPTVFDSLASLSYLQAGVVWAERV